MTTSAGRPGNAAPRRRGRSLNGLALQLSAVALSFTLVALLVVHTSQQAFTATTDNNSDNVSAANLVLTDNDTGQAMFAVSNAIPGTNYDRCITVTYTGGVVPTPVMLYSSQAATGNANGNLAPYLDLTIDVGTATSATFSGADSSGCTGFSPSSGTPLYTGTLDAFSTKNSYATGVTAWSPSASGDARTFRFRISVHDDPNAENLAAQNFAFQWETRSS